MKQHYLINEITEIVAACAADRLTGSLTVRIDFSQGGIGHATAFREYKSEEPNTFITKKTPLNGINETKQKNSLDNG